ASDVYGMAASLRYWITGDEPSDTAWVASTPAGAFAEADEVLGDGAIELLARCLEEDDRLRPSISEILASIVLEPSEPSLPRNPEVRSAGEMLEGQFEIIRVLGRGGSAVTYLARDTMAEELYVLKTIQN